MRCSDTATRAPATGSWTTGRRPSHRPGLQPGTRGPRPDACGGSGLGLVHETVRLRLALKPWCIPKVSTEHKWPAWRTLDLYAEPYDPERPVVCDWPTSRRPSRRNRGGPIQAVPESGNVGTCSSPASPGRAATWRRAPCRTSPIRCSGWWTRHK